MPDWTKQMTQSFEYYEVDPNTWKDKKLLTNVESCTIDRDAYAISLGSASIDIIGSIEECYIRIYLITNQNGLINKIPLGIYLIQTPNITFDGITSTVSIDAYTPLLELSEKPVPLGYALLKDDNIMEQAYMILKNNCRAPVIKTESDKLLENNFISNVSDNWLVYINDLIRLAKYSLNLDENGKIIFEPIQKIEELQPVWTYNDDNSSILYPKLSLKQDLYKIPNVVEIICSTANGIYTARVENNDINSPISIINRGRQITYRETSPSLSGIPTVDEINEYAERTLKNLSSLEYEVSYSHGYCDVRVGDCVRLNYTKAGLIDIKAKVISQSIKCNTGCRVSETAVFTKKLWK